MKKSYIKIFTSFIIVGLLVAGCTATGKKKSTKAFKHNTPLIKTDIKELGKVEVDKMAKMGPTPVESPFFNTLMDSLSKFNVFCDRDNCLLNLIYPKKFPVISKSTGIL